MQRALDSIAQPLGLKEQPLSGDAVASALRRHPFGLPCVEGLPEVLGLTKIEGERLARCRVQETNGFHSASGDLHALAHGVRRVLKGIGAGVETVDRAVA